MYNYDAHVSPNHSCISHVQCVLLQGASPLQSAFTVASSLAFDNMSYGKGSAANRSASMDSDISSWSPVPKRHCFYPPRVCSNSESAHYDWHQAQQQQDALQQQQQLQHASIEVPSLSDAQKAYALKVMLSQSSAQEAAALIAALQRFQYLRQAAASHHTQAQAPTHSSQSTVKQPAARHLSNRLPASTNLKLQAPYCQALQAPHQQQHSDALLPPQHVATANTQSPRLPLGASIMQLQGIPTPLQHCKEPSGIATGSQPVSLVWYQDQAVPEPNTAAYEPIQSQTELHWGAYSEQASQPELTWQSAATVCEAQPSQLATGVVTQSLHREQQERIVFQLAQQKWVRLQQQMALEHQAFLERQAAVSPIRPALTFPELVAYWARDLSLQRCESVYLACHLWTRVQPQVSHQQNSPPDSNA